MHNDYKEKELVYDGRLQSCSYNFEYCELTNEFPASVHEFRNEHCFVFSSHQIEVQTDKMKEPFFGTFFSRGKKHWKIDHFWLMFK